MLAQIEQWIDKTNSVYAHKRICCEKFANEFEGFYPNEFLKTAFYVVVDKIPKPDFTGLRELGLSNFIDMDVAGITYKNTYYILPSAVHNLRVHFHELVHVVQWRELGAHAFIMRYINEIQMFGYNDAPLEIMAYELDEHYTSNGNKFNIPDYITQQL
ncbi:hypothetical protein CWB76_14335 [Pseudoalteromonas sp. S1609]|uniref:hypothetical protein n=1 Tax=Pseudoalteromonas sp. S1609 TaxID=579505 RepID=UPI00110A2CC5|nr:hypothetical protein [Pseudoalteromonas sp. S1609]TMP68754.1 hypothetical protein CWB76_14335 [Pseudoalteromonas sp. S1609]